MNPPHQLPERPLARTDVITEPVDDGTIVYVAQTQEAHHLDRLASSLWHSCDGVRTVAELGRRPDCDPATVQATLQRLADAGLLVRSAPPAGDDLIDRRDILRRLAIGGVATSAAAGTIMTVGVPSALAAMSNVQNLNLYATAATTCNTAIGTNVRGTVVATVSAGGAPTVDKLTLVVTLSAYTTGLTANIFNISVNCGTVLGTIASGSTGAGGPVTVTTTVPHGQTSVITLVPQLQPSGTTVFVKATPPFTA